MTRTIYYTFLKLPVLLLAGLHIFMKLSEEQKQIPKILNSWILNSWKTATEKFRIWPQSLLELSLPLSYKRTIKLYAMDPLSVLPNGSTLRGSMAYSCSILLYHFFFAWYMSTYESVIISSSIPNLGLPLRSGLLLSIRPSITSFLINHHLTEHAISAPRSIS